LRQVLFNLLGNAVKFTPQGQVVLQVEVAVGESPPVWRFSVADTGIGMTREQQQHLFEVFSQADTSITRQFGGSGLGLAISKQLVELMGGGIVVESEPDKGSLFTVTLPLHPVAAPPESGTGGAVATASLAGCRVLVVEDNEINQLVIRAFLQRAGIEPEVIANGQAALERMMRQPQALDLVLMDCEIPVLDGLSTVRRYRQWEQGRAQRRLPIIALTANALPQYRDACLQAGMDDFLTKPVMQQALLSALSAALGRQA
jgi:hypothetical protein